MHVGLVAAGLANILGILVISRGSSGVLDMLFGTFCLRTALPSNR